MQKEEGMMKRSMILIGCGLVVLSGLTLTSCQKKEAEKEASPKQEMKQEAPISVPAMKEKAVVPEQKVQETGAPATEPQGTAIPPAPTSEAMPSVPAPEQQGPAVPPAPAPEAVPGAPVLPPEVVPPLPVPQTVVVPSMPTAPPVAVPSAPVSPVEVVPAMPPAVPAAPSPLPEVMPGTPAKTTEGTVGGNESGAR